MTSLMNKLAFELEEISVARNDCAAEDRFARDALAGGDLASAAKHARAAAKKADQLRIMLSHIADVIERETPRPADHYEDSPCVYEGA